MKKKSKELTAAEMTTAAHGAMRPPPEEKLREVTAEATESGTQFPVNLFGTPTGKTRKKKEIPHHGLPESQIREMSGRIRTAYINQKKHLCRIDHYTVNSRHDDNKFWVNAAITCIKLEADPELFVAAQFEGTVRPYTIFPNILSGAEAMRRFEAYCKARNIPTAKQDPAALKRMRLETAELAVAAALRIIHRIKGVEFSQADIAEIMQQSCYAIQPVVRLLYCWNDPEVLAGFGYAGQRQLIKSQTLREGFKMLCLPVEYVLSLQFQRPEDYIDETTPSSNP